MFCIGQKVLSDSKIYVLYKTKVYRTSQDLVVKLINVPQQGQKYFLSCRLDIHDFTTQLYARKGILDLV